MWCPDFGSDPVGLIGDSIIIEHGQPVTVTITAPPGTNLYYLCAIHPWMQGVLQVK
jgi:hypothetical protein